MAARKKPAPKRGASRNRAPAKKPMPGWIWLACGLAIGVFVMLLMNLKPGDDAIKRAAEQKAQHSQKKAQEAKAKADAGPDKPKYDFYTLLPGSEVIVPPEAVDQAPPTPAAKPVTPEEAAKIDTARAEAALAGEVPPPPPPVIAKAPVTTTYFLQAGSFRRKDDADSVRAQIIMLGQSVNVESGKVRDETWYRVLVGPFATREALNKSQSTLSKNGFNNLLLQQRQGN